jgi:hypothetical protein
MSGYVEAKSGGQYVLSSIRYRNLAPLYCDEEMRICCKIKKSFDHGDLYDVWIEGPTGGVAVMGTVRTARRPAADVKRTTPISQADNEASGSQESDSRSNEQPSTPRVKSPSTRGMPLTGKENSGITRRRSIIRRVDSSSGTVTFAPTPKSNVPDRKFNHAQEESPALDLEPRNRRKRRTIKYKGLLPAVSFQILKQHNRASRLSLSRFEIPDVSPRHGSAGQSPYVRRIEALQSPSNGAMTLKGHNLARCVVHSESTNLLARPTSLIRQYRSKEYNHDPTNIASRYSRYLREGARKIAKPRISKVAYTRRRTRP